MKEVDYIPSACLDKTDDEGNVTKAAFKGSLKMRVPTFEERWAYHAQMGVKVTKDGVDQAALEEDQMGMAVKMAKLAAAHIMSASLTKLSNNTEYKSYEDMSYDQECDPILFELGMAMLRGFGPTPKQ